MPKQVSELRKLFLMEFVKALIINSVPIVEAGKKFEKISDSVEGEMMPSMYSVADIENSEKSQHFPEAPKPYVEETHMLHNIPMMDELKGFIIEPTIQSIECSGPDKPLILIKNGRTLSTGVKLSGEEINRVMKEFSLKTKIPLISGVFKAALGNFIVTAVISEYVGTRFLIEKRNPFYQ